MNAPARIPQTISIGDVNEVALTEQAGIFLDTAKQITVVDQASLQAASNYLRENKAEQKRLDDERRSLTDPLNKVVKDLNGKFKPLLETLQNAERIVKGAVSQFQIAEDRRIAAERAAAEEAARKERERLENQAVKLAEKGKEEQAQAKMEQAATTVAVAPVEQAKADGVSTRKTWKADVVDVRKVCALIASGEIPATVVQFKPLELNRLASMYQDTKQFEGLRIYADITVASR